MELKNYFENTKGLGVLATSDKTGKVNVAIYARPHIGDNNTVSFIMADRLSHSNLQENEQAAYIFTEEGNGYKGKRLYLKKLSEDTDPDKIASLRRRPLPKSCEAGDGEKRFLVTFELVEERPLVG